MISDEWLLEEVPEGPAVIIILAEFLSQFCEILIACSLFHFFFQGNANGRGEN